MDIGPFVKRQPASNSRRFSRRTIRETWVRVHTGAMLVAPSSLAAFPGSDNPAISVLVSTGGIRRRVNLVVVGPSCELRSPFQHDAILRTEACERRVAAILNPEFHQHLVRMCDNFRAKGNLVGYVLVQPDIEY